MERITNTLETSGENQGYARNKLGRVALSNILAFLQSEVPFFQLSSKFKYTPKYTQ